PANYNKLRYLENHDTQRIAARVKDGLSLKNYTAMLYFLKGTTLVYAGQERAATHTPSLFDADKVQWDAGTDLTPLMQTLYQLKQQTLSPDDLFSAEADEADHIAVMTRDDGKTRKIGVFSLRGLPGEVSVDLPDGAYSDLLSGAKAEVRGGKLSCSGEPIWICAP
ncbi:MAG: alpha-amylase, partial [Firmicutes bacterium]|nr:alpha-amylase [Bacillota bacterium]